MSDVISPASMEAKQRENLTALNEQRRQRLQMIEVKSREQKTQVEVGTATQIGNMEEQKGKLQFTIGNLESTLASLPPGHPERGKIEKAISVYRKRLAEISEAISTLKSRSRSQMRMINFQALMQKKNLEITVTRQASLVKAKFAEIIGSMMANSAQPRGPRPTEQKEQASASG